MAEKRALIGRIEALARANPSWAPDLRLLIALAQSRAGETQASKGGDAQSLANHQRSYAQSTQEYEPAPSDTSEGEVRGWPDDAAVERARATFYAMCQDCTDTFEDLGSDLQAQIVTAALIAARPPAVGEGAVDFYERELYPLSNFSAFTLMWPDGWPPERRHRFDTSEAAYHWEKYVANSPGVAAIIRSAPSAHEAFKEAEKYRSARRPDWDEVKVPIMRRIIRAKAAQHEYVRRKLLETGDRPLIEGSWRDDFWGSGPKGDGQNMLGKLWMELRTELRAAPTLPTLESET